MHFAEAGTNVPTINTSYSPDPLTLQIISTTDANGTQRGATYDPYGRRLLSTITTASNGQGVMTSVTYDGFAPTDPTWSSGRRMTVKSFTDPVAVGAVATAAGRTSTVYLDELGRERQTQLALGADYSNETLVVGARTYDGLGRVVFIADPYPISQTAATAYGTTRYFATDSTLRLSVRGNGPQPFTSVPDASVERFPTLLTHSFSNHQEQISVQDAASLTAGTPQNGVVKSSITSAIGRLLARSTWQNGTRIEHAAFAQDRLGNLTTLTRYQDPSGLNGAVQWSWMYDSLGQVLQLLEPSNAPQTRSYSSFGELTQVLWTPPAPSRRTPSCSSSTPSDGSSIARSRTAPCATPPPSPTTSTTSAVWRRRRSIRRTCSAGSRMRPRRRARSSTATTASGTTTRARSPIRTPSGTSRSRASTATIARVAGARPPR